MYRVEKVFDSSTVSPALSVATFFFLFFLFLVVLCHTVLCIDLLMAGRLSRNYRWRT